MCLKCHTGHFDFGLLHYFSIWPCGISFLWFPDVCNLATYVASMVAGYFVSGSVLACDDTFLYFICMTCQDSFAIFFFFAPCAVLTA